MATLAEAFRPGVRVRDASRREVSSSLIYMWRKRMREGKLGSAIAALPTFAEVRGAKSVAPAPCASGLFVSTCLAACE